MQNAGGRFQKVSTNFQFHFLFQSLKLKCDRQVPCSSCSESKLSFPEAKLIMSQPDEVVRRYVQMGSLLQAIVSGMFHGGPSQLDVSQFA